jgi:fused signal recognition particle receptor
MVILLVGVNGTGKTTTAAKLARHLQLQNHSVMLGAADTFRAAAVEQLSVWGERLNIPVIAGQPNADPGAVAHDAVSAARARNLDVLIVDTAGRLQTKFNLMEELKKVRGVIGKTQPSAPHETFLVLDATTGQNALSQARAFKDTTGLTGVVLSKLDGSAKGGMAFAIGRELGVPIRFVGTGEKFEDLAVFDPEKFVAGLLD